MTDWVERIARAWASIDGKAARFDDDKAGMLPDDDGTYLGYIAEAEELIRRSGLAAVLVPSPIYRVPVDTEEYRRNLEDVITRQPETAATPVSRHEEARTEAMASDGPQPPADEERASPATAGGKKAL